MSRPCNRGRGDGLGQYECEGRPLAFYDHGHGQWTFTERLRRPVAGIPSDSAAA